MTGTFDGWKKTEKLEKVGDRFEKLVHLDDASQKIDYKVRDSRFLPVPRALLFPCPLASSCVLSRGHLPIRRHARRAQPMRKLRRATRSLRYERNPQTFVNAESPILEARNRGA